MGHDFAAVLNLRPRLRAYASRLTRDVNETHDLLQDTYLLAWRAWPRFEPRPTLDIVTAVSAWAHDIMRNRFLSGKRRPANRYVLLSMDVHGGVGEAGFHPDFWADASRPDTHERRAYQSSNLRSAQDTEPGSAESDFSDEMVDALATLTPRGRDLVLRVDLHGQSYAQVASELAIPIGTVMSGLWRARNTLAVATKDLAASMRIRKHNRQTHARSETC